MKKLIGRGTRIKVFPPGVNEQLPVGGEAHIQQAGMKMQLVCRTSSSPKYLENIDMRICSTRIFTAISSIFISSLILMAHGVMAEDLVVADGHHDFGPMSAATQELFLRGVHDQSVLTFPFSTVAGDLKQESIWRAELSTATAEVTRVRILFSRRWHGQEGHGQEGAASSATLSSASSAESDINVSEESEDFFSVFIEYSDAGVKLKSSRSGLESPDTGLTLLGGERKIVPVTVVPNAGLRMVLFAPRISNDRTNGFYLCPRIYHDQHTQPGGTSGAEDLPPASRVLVDGGFRIVSVQTEVVGVLRGKIVGGFGPARAEGKILTSVDIARSAEYKDETFNRDPSISMDYLANKADPYIVFDDLSTPITERASGIQVTIGLHNAAGYKMVESLEEVQRIKEIRYPPETPLYLNATLTSGTGPCYLFLKERKRTTTYSKENLVVPERFATETPAP